MGSRKGIPNARTVELLDIAQELDCNPFEVLIHFAKRDYVALGLSEFTEKKSKTGEKILEPTISPETQMSAASKACEYLYPKRKAIEHSAGDGSELFEKLISGLSGNNT